MRNAELGKVNVMFLGGAKRVSFGKKLIAAAEKRGVDLRIFSYELDRRVPIAVIGDVIIGRRWNSADLLEHMHTIVLDYNIDILLPFVDGAVGVAARYVKRFGDAWSPVGTPEMSEQFFDKVVSDMIFKQASLPVPVSCAYGGTQLPLIAKPRHGSASKGIVVIDNPSKWDELAGGIDEYLIQQYIQNRTEYTVDCYISADGEILCISPRQRLEVIGGEVSRSVTVEDYELESLSEQTIRRLGLRGAATIQFLRDNDTGRLMIMEINPRLGGGVVCSIAAGADIPGLILDEYMGKSLHKADNIKQGTLICRYFEEAVFYEE